MEGLTFPLQQTSVLTGAKSTYSWAGDDSGTTGAGSLGTAKSGGGGCKKNSNGGAIGIGVAGGCIWAGVGNWSACGTKSST